ncbi:MAG: ATP-grasp domain-containing protein [Alphaproteobacteria bacterium]|nr:ATP-grasp domain-containing protein [Alphaproteobacteria bacterium]
MFTRLLIANRGEIAIRLARAAADLGITTTGVYSDDDALSLHVKVPDEAIALVGVGARAYLDGAQIIRLAKEAGADAIHPGYGFLSENAAFASACAEAGICFVGPNPRVLSLFGDKTRARALAKENGVPILPGTAHGASLDEIGAFLAGEGAGAIMLKAVAGGGGRGMRMVTAPEDLADAFERCRSEAKTGFGDDRVYAERLIRNARHIEVQIIGDRHGSITHAFERDCSVQRRNQKILEIAPAPFLAAPLRQRIIEAALALARAAEVDSLATIEFLVDLDRDDSFFFIEANPRLQVEHTVTEEVTGLDLVATQIAIAAGGTLESLGLSKPPSVRGHAIQMRINAEIVAPDGMVKPAGGVITAFEPPSGPGLRVDASAYAGYAINPNFDSMIAKLIVRNPSDDFAVAVARASRALRSFRIEGPATSLPLHASLLAHPALTKGPVATRFLSDNLAKLAAAPAPAPAYFEGAGPLHPADAAEAHIHAAPEGTIAAAAPLRGTIVSIDIAEGDAVTRGQTLAILDAMKMEHVVTAGVAGTVRLIVARPGDTLSEGQAILFIAPGSQDSEAAADAQAIDLDAIRPDLAEVIARTAVTLDENRPDAVARRRKTGQRTARENVDDLCDPGSFIEYGQLTVAAQRRRRSMEELVKISPADGMVCGLGAVNGTLFDETRARTAVLAYDYTVFAGTQGHMNHKKTDRVLEVAEKAALPIVFFVEGGGGRPGDTDGAGVAGLDVPTFHTFAKLSGLAPRIAINSGRCFAGNAALFGCADITIATMDSTIGMGGPAMIEGGGLGIFKPDDVGPMDMQTRNGVVDIAVADEAAGVRAAKQALGYFQGPVADYSYADQRHLRRLIPENRLRVYDIRPVIETLADEGSVLELRPLYGQGMITAFIRIEGRPFGLIANDSRHLGGAIDATGAEKAARFLQLCDAFDVPILSLCDTPGFMVGPDSEREAAVRRVSRMFVAGANVSVPLFCVVLRKGYGLGAQAMAGGSFARNAFIISWPTGEFGGMGLEGAVRLGYRKELAAETDPDKQKALFDKLLTRLYDAGKAISMAAALEIDAVIDPVETRAWVIRGLKSWAPPPARVGKKRSFIDTF